LQKERSTEKINTGRNGSTVRKIEYRKKDRTEIKRHIEEQNSTEELYAFK